MLGDDEDGGGEGEEVAEAVDRVKRLQSIFQSVSNRGCVDPVPNRTYVVVAILYPTEGLRLVWGRRIHILMWDTRLPLILTVYPIPYTGIGSREEPCTRKITQHQCKWS